MDATRLRKHVEDICAVSAFFDPEQYSPYGLADRLEGYLSNSRARLDVVVSKFLDMGYEPEFHDFTFYGRAARHAVFRKGGPGDDELWLVAHHDYCAGLGAEDNATGLAVMLELAHHFRDSPAAEHLVFASFDLEERCLKGSREYAARLPAREREAIRYLIALECLGSGKDLTVCTSMSGDEVKSDPGLVDALCSCASDLGHEVIASDYPCYSSDHEPFARLGVRVAELASINFSRYARSLLRSDFNDRLQSGSFSAAHTQSDTPESLNYGQMADAASILAEFIKREYAE